MQCWNRKVFKLLIKTEFQTLSVEKYVHSYHGIFILSYLNILKVEVMIICKIVLVWRVLQSDSIQYTHMCVCVCVYIYVYVYICTHTHIYIYIYICIYYVYKILLFPVLYGGFLLFIYFIHSNVSFSSITCNLSFPFSLW